MVVSCEICGKQFDSFRGLNGHRNAHIKRAESYKPPASAVAAAKKGLSQRKEWGRGGMSPSEAKSQGIDSGVTRARKISSGSVSRHDVRRMSAFNRHRQNNRPEKKMPDGGPTAGTIAWNLWGGTSGVNWAKKKSATMNAERGCSYPCPDCGTMMYQHNSSMGFGSHCSCFKCGSNYITKPMNAESLSTNGFNLGTIDDPICEICGSNMYEDSDQPLRKGIMFRCHNYECPDLAEGGQRQQFYEYEEYDSENWGGDPKGQLSKALANVRDKAKRYAPTPLRLTKLPHPDQKNLKDFEADEWKLLPRDSLGRWQKPVRSESINELRESLQTSVPAISELLNLYGGDNPNNRFKLYNDLQSLKIDAMDAALPDDTDMTLDNLDMSWMTPQEYYEYILEEPIDVPDDTEDDSTTIEFQERLVRYTAMTMLPPEVESLIKENIAEITEDLFADNEEADSEINFLNAVKRYQKLSEQWSAEE